jgi:hypothetical protein
MLQANPELMKQSLEMMRTMPADQLQAAAQAAGAPPGFFSADRMEELAAQVRDTCCKLSAVCCAFESCSPQRLHTSCIDHLTTAHLPTLPSVSWPAIN